MSINISRIVELNTSINRPAGARGTYLGNPILAGNLALSQPDHTHHINTWPPEHSDCPAALNFHTECAVLGSVLLTLIIFDHNL